MVIVRPDDADEVLIEAGRFIGSSSERDNRRQMVQCCVNIQNIMIYTVSHRVSHWGVHSLSEINSCPNEERLKGQESEEMSVSSLLIHLDAFISWKGCNNTGVGGEVTSESPGV